MEKQNTFNPLSLTSEFSLHFFNGRSFFSLSIDYFSLSILPCSVTSCISIVLLAWIQILK